jgi:chromosome segregation ATPase
MFKNLQQDNARQEHVNAVFWLLKPLEPDWGEAVKNALDTLRSGGQVSQAGESLAAGLATILQERATNAVQLADENADLKRRLADLENENYRLGANSRTLEDTMEELKERCTRQEKDIARLELHISIQNEVLAEQHYKLANIFGHSNNSTSA